MHKSYFPAGRINQQRTAVKSKLVSFTSWRIRLLFINKHGALGHSERDGKGLEGPRILRALKATRQLLSSSHISQTRICGLSVSYCMGVTHGLKLKCSNF